MGMMFHRNKLRQKEMMGQKSAEVKQVETPAEPVEAKESVKDEVPEPKRRGRRPKEN